MIMVQIKEGKYQIAHVLCVSHFEFKLIYDARHCKVLEVGDFL